MNISSFIHSPFIFSICFILVRVRVRVYNDKPGSEARPSQGTIHTHSHTQSVPRDYLESAVQIQIILNDEENVKTYKQAYTESMRKKDIAIEISLGTACLSIWDLHTGYSVKG